MGHAFIFFSIVSASFVPALARRFGRPFVTLHHWIAFTGLALITLHPVLFALTGGGLAVFVPDVSSWRSFWVFAGRPAWFLLLAAAGAARLRQRFKNGWRIVHGLTYVAFAMGAVHAGLLGASFVIAPVARGALYALAALAFAALVWRRYQDWQRAQARSRRQRS